MTSAYLSRFRQYTANIQGQRSRSQRNVSGYQPQKRYYAAMDRFSDFKLGVAS